ncbi:MAG: hypothetical protein V3S94_07425 [Gammaproteobacteria bacterium]
MAKIEDAVALGIGPQTALGTINDDVRDATELIDTVASPSGATGILLRNPEDLAKAMERIESDGGVVAGSRTRATGAKSRIVPTVSFDIDLKGNGGTATPSAGEFNALEYMIQILQGNRFIQEATPGGTSTAYEFGIPTAAQSHKTLKIWRGTGAPGSDEAWVLQDCTFNLSLAYVAGEKCVLTADVFAGLVIYHNDSTFPAAPDFSTQVEAAPILSLAGASVDGVVRGFRSATLAIVYPEVDVPDSNATGGTTKQIGSPRDVQFTADWYGDDASDDFPDLLESDVGVPIFFTLGVPATAGLKINAWRVDMPLFRGVTTDKVDVESGDVVRTITGYASHTTGDAELVLTAV